MARFLNRLRAIDEQRPGFPGEHLLTFGAGSLLLRSARRRHSRVARTLATLAGAALIARALSGRDGVRRLARRQ